MQLTPCTPGLNVVARLALSQMLSPLFFCVNIEFGGAGGQADIAHHLTKTYFNSGPSWALGISLLLIFCRDYHLTYLSLRGLVAFLGPSFPARLSFP